MSSMCNGKYVPFIVTARLAQTDRIRAAELDAEALRDEYRGQKLSGRERSRGRAKSAGKTIKNLLLSLYGLAMFCLFAYSALLFGRSCESAPFWFIAALMLFGFASLLADVFKRPLNATKRRRSVRKIESEPDVTELRTFVFGRKRLFVYDESELHSYYYDDIDEGTEQLDYIVELSDGLMIKTYDRQFWLPARFISQELGERLTERLRSLPKYGDEKPFMTLRSANYPEYAENPGGQLFTIPQTQPDYEVTPRPIPEPKDDDLTVTRVALYGDILAVTENGDDIFFPLDRITRLRYGKENGDITIDQKGFGVLISAADYEPDSLPDKYFVGRVAERLCPGVSGQLEEKRKRK